MYNDEAEECEYCQEKRFKPAVENDVELTKVPSATIKILSIGDVIAQLLGNNKTREQLRYRVDREVEEGTIRDYFDGQDYKNFKANFNAFAGPDDVALAIYTDGFINENKGKLSYTIIHVVVLNYDPYLRLVVDYYKQLNINKYLLFF